MPRSKSAPAPAFDDPELELLRAARPDFYGNPSYGEVRLLQPGEIPDMLANYGEGLPTAIATWAAEEADGAAIGRLILPDVPMAQRPIVMIDNEGSTSLTGFSWVDHFGASTSAAYDGELEELLEFCQEHGLPGPRTEEEIERLAESLGLDDDELGEGNVPRIDPAKLAAIHGSQTPSSDAAASKEPAAKKPVAKKTAAKKPTTKKTATKKPAAKKPAAKKPAAKKPAAKKPAAKKPAAKKPTTKKPAAKKPAAKKPAAKKPAAKKPAAKKPTRT